jgi:hypothetical protein
VAGVAAVPLAGVSAREYREELTVVVRETGVVPVRLVVTIEAGYGEALAAVLPVIVSLMARQAIGVASRLELRVEPGNEVATLAAQQLVRASESEPVRGSRMVERSSAPAEGGVTFLAVGAETECDVVDRRCADVVAPVAGDAFGIDRGESASAIIRVTRFARQEQMRTIERKGCPGVDLLAPHVGESCRLVAVITTEIEIAPMNVDVAFCALVGTGSVESQTLVTIPAVRRTVGVSQWESR